MTAVRQASLPSRSEEIIEMERPSFPCKFLSTSCKQKERGARNRLDDLFDFGNKDVNELTHVSGIILSTKPTTVNGTTQSLMLAIRDCSIDPNCANNNCLGDANVKQANRLYGLVTIRAVCILIEKPAFLDVRKFTGFMFDAGGIGPQPEDVVFVVGKVMDYSF